MFHTPLCANAAGKQHVKLALEIRRQHDGILMARRGGVVVSNVLWQRARVLGRVGGDLAAELGRVVVAWVVILHLVLMACMMTMVMMVMEWRSSNVWYDGARQGELRFYGEGDVPSCLALLYTSKSSLPLKSDNKHNTVHIYIHGFINLNLQKATNAFVLPFSALVFGEW